MSRRVAVVAIASVKVAAKLREGRDVSTSSPRKGTEGVDEETWTRKQKGYESDKPRCSISTKNAEAVTRDNHHLGQLPHHENKVGTGKVILQGG